MPVRVVDLLEVIEIGEEHAERLAVARRVRVLVLEHGVEMAAVEYAGEVVADSMALSAAMWTHAPEMHELMAEQAVVWPKFEAGDMEDLAAYLRRSMERGGRGRNSEEDTAAALRKGSGRSEVR